MRVWYNPSLRFDNFVVISMIALAAYMVGVIHPAASIVKQKESGTIEQLAASPLTPRELVFARSLPTFVIGLLALGPALLISRLFGVPFRRSHVAFALFSAVFLVSAIGTGVLIASAVRTLQQASCGWPGWASPSSPEASFSSDAGWSDPPRETVLIRASDPLHAVAGRLGV